MLTFQVKNSRNPDSARHLPAAELFSEYYSEYELTFFDEFFLHTSLFPTSAEGRQRTGSGSFGSLEMIIAPPPTTSISEKPEHQ